MSKKAKRIILTVAIIQIVIIVAILALPKVVLAIPGRYRVALSLTGFIVEEVFHMVLPAAETARHGAGGAA